MKAPSNGARWGTLLFAMALAAGCGPAGLTDVTGKVTLDGKPLDAGKVVFEPIGQGRPAIGDIQADGTFELVTDGAAGAAPGEYAVGVVPAGLIGSEFAPPPGPAATVPKRYHSATTSDLVYKVDAGGENHFDIPLKTKQAPR